MLEASLLKGSTIQAAVMFYLSAKKQLEAKVLKVNEVANTTKESQIGGENQVEELTGLVNHILKKSDEWEEDRQKKDKQIISIWKNVCVVLKTKIVK